MRPFFLLAGSWRTSGERTVALKFDFIE